VIDWSGELARMRRAFWRTAHSLEPNPPLLAEIRDTRVPGAETDLPARLYTPFAAGAPTGPGLVFFHGGGFVTGDLDSHHAMCRRLAAASGVRVLSVAYRLAPQHKHPAAADDALAAMRWALQHGTGLGLDPERLALGGDSAGGTLTAVTAQALRASPTPRPLAQLLIYPCTQLVEMRTDRIGWRSGPELAQQVAQAAQDYFKDQYLAARDHAFDPRVSPLLADDLSGLPPALVITAGRDPLRDEGQAYAQKMAAFGVPVTLRDYPNELHGFFSLTAVSASARDAIEETGRWLAAALRVRAPVG
jgi:acetyl esterase